MMKLSASAGKWVAQAPLVDDDDEQEEEEDYDEAELTLEEDDNQPTPPMPKAIISSSSSSSSSSTRSGGGDPHKLTTETKTASGVMVDTAQQLLDELNQMQVVPPPSSSAASQLSEGNQDPAEALLPLLPPAASTTTLNDLATKSMVISSPGPDEDEDEDASAPREPSPTEGPSTSQTTTPTNESSASSSQTKQQFPAFKVPAKTPNSAVPLHLRGQAYQRERHNSTNTVLVPNAIQAPNLEDLVRCMSAALCYHIETCTNDGKQHKYYEILDETLFPLTKAHNNKNSNSNGVPDVNTVWGFLMPVFTSERLGAEICIMTLAYVERVMANEDLGLLPNTWRRTTLGALILASKVWEDQSVWNVDFVHCFDNLTALDLNKLERMFLNLTHFEVGLKASLYVKYFIELQNYSPKQRRNPYSPGEQAAAALEVITIGKQKEMKKMSSRRTASASDIPLRR